MSPVRPSRTARTAIASIAAGAAASVCFGQAQVQSGRALDANLQVGSSGFNSRVNNVPLAARNYAPFMGSVNAQFQARNALTNYRLGLMDVTFNTFLNERAYTPVRGSTANTWIVPSAVPPLADPQGWEQSAGPPGSTLPSSWRRAGAYQQVAPGAYLLDLRVGAGG